MKSLTEFIKESYEQDNLDNVRIEMMSNYDCFNSNYFNVQCGGYAYDNESYFSDMIDFLNLNPAKVYTALVEYLDDIYLDAESFVYMPDRDGKEYVNYDMFAREITNNTSSAALLTFIGYTNTTDLDSIKEVSMKKGTPCGLFDSFNGDGSYMGMKLLRPMTASVGDLKANDYKPILRVVPDTNYSIEKVYGDLCADNYDIIVK